MLARMRALEISTTFNFFVLYWFDILNILSQQKKQKLEEDKSKHIRSEKVKVTSSMFHFYYLIITQIRD